MRNKHWDCIGIGLCTLDRISLLQYYPSPNEKVKVCDYRICGGGPVANAICTLAQLGDKVAFVGKIGDDEEGKIISEEFRHVGVNIDNLFVSQCGNTPSAQIWVDKRNGDRTVVLQEIDTPQLSKSNIPLSLIRESKSLLLNGRDTDINLYAGELAKKFATTVILDLGSLRERMEDLLKLADIIITSEKFAQAYRNQATPLEVCRKLRSYGGSLAVVTLGDKGCVWSGEEGEGSMEAFPVKVVDTTGAGDVFHGAFIHGLIQEWKLEKTIRFAQAAAAISCSILGGRGAVVSENQVWNYIIKL